MSPERVVLAVDCMGGDHGLKVTLPACIRFLNSNPDTDIVCVGNQPEIQEHLRGLDGQEKSLAKDLQSGGRITFVHADQVVAMDDPPAIALRTKRQSSMRIGADLVRNYLRQSEHETENSDSKSPFAHALISAGNTGALMAISRFVLKMQEGIDRPAIAAQLPQSDGTAVTMLDLGANVDCGAEHLLQFGLMGSALVNALDANPNPRVGLLNIGEEVIKGNDVVKQAGELLKSSGLNFIGNVEGNDIYHAKADVIVCDGFVGNVALKTSEGLAQMISKFLRDEFSSGVLSKISALIALPVLRRFKNRIDHRRYNGASLIGLRGIVIKSHGSADAFAFEQALRRAHDAVHNDLLGKIQLALKTARESAAVGAFQSNQNQVSSEASVVE